MTSHRDRAPSPVRMNEDLHDRYHPPHKRSPLRWLPRLVDVRVWLLIAIYFTIAMGDNSYAFYVPRFLQSQFPTWSPFRIGLAVAAGERAGHGQYGSCQHTLRPDR